MCPPTVRGELSVFCELLGGRSDRAGFTGIAGGAGAASAGISIGNFWTGVPMGAVLRPCPGKARLGGAPPEAAGRSSSFVMLS